MRLGHLLALATDAGLDVERWPDAPCAFTGCLVWGRYGAWILLNTSLSEAEQFITIAHELGHWLLGHRGLSYRASVWRSDPDEEQEADAFARRLLALVRERTTQLL